MTSPKFIGVRGRGILSDADATELLHQSNEAGAADKVAFAYLLRQLRTEQGLTQAAVAKAAGVSAGYIGLIETGDRGRPSLDIVRRIAQALNATVADTERLLKATGYMRNDEQLIPDRGPTFAQFVDAHPRLSVTQKALLKGIVESWLGKDG